ncbi:DnaJ -like protein subfamily C member 17 [Triplophysa tibetana]|uniref:DnaJ-like protein subfamily C member 17 n=1 Tax=Triplophysa tibetana TaxID=1572043 RepID=A0A5A9NPE2_9TELE|nr:DnaJ -like protein subfamily C member 17 [Triplophysa tibetana]
MFEIRWQKRVLVLEADDGVRMHMRAALRVEFDSNVCCDLKREFGSDVSSRRRTDSERYPVTRTKTQTIPKPAAYDKVQAAKKQAEERNRKLDDKRKKIKLGQLPFLCLLCEDELMMNTCTSLERTLFYVVICVIDLETREKRAEDHKTEEVKVTRSLEEELKWKCKKDDASNGGYSQECLQNLFQKYGDVLNILISSKKAGSAVIEFDSVKAADLAFKNESGLTGNPLKITWLEGQPEPASRTNTPADVFYSSQIVSEKHDYEGVIFTLTHGEESRVTGERVVNASQGQLKPSQEACCVPCVWVRLHRVCRSRALGLGALEDLACHSRLTFCWKRAGFDDEQHVACVMLLRSFWDGLKLGNRICRF